MTLVNPSAIKAFQIHISLCIWGPAMFQALMSQKRTSNTQPLSTRSHHKDLSGMMENV